VDRSTLAVLVLLADFAIRIGVGFVIIMRSAGSPAVRLAWLTVVLIVPVVGGPLYLLLGGIRLSKDRRRRHREAYQWLRDQEWDDPPVSAIMPGRAGALVEALGGDEPTTGNVLRLFAETDEASAALIEDIHAARERIDLLVYIYLDDATGRAVGEALIDAARRGIACRLLVDAFGSKRFLRSPLRKQLKAAGIHVLPALPVNLFGVALARLDHRNHRKIFVIDGRIGWTGSMNIASAAFDLKPKYAPWVDVAVRVEGPAVFDLHTLFIEDWVVESREDPGTLRMARPRPLESDAIVQVLGTAPHRYPLALRELSVFGLLGGENQITMTTPYFVPDEVTVTALVSSARAGVPTTLIVPKRNDSPLVAAASRSFYERLLQAGVRLYEFRPGLLHAKTVTLGDDRSVISTANLDRRSYELNFEVTMFVVDLSFGEKLRALQEYYIANSDEVVLEKWQRRGGARRFAENLVGVMAPLL
jgi:cardiolipin synthase